MRARAMTSAELCRAAERVSLYGMADTPTAMTPALRDELSALETDASERLEQALNDLYTVGVLLFGHDDSEPVSGATVQAAGSLVRHLAGDARDVRELQDRCALALRAPV